MVVYYQIMPRNEFYIPKNYIKIYKKFREIAEREGTSPSRIICRLMRDYVLHHEKGNPQKFLQLPKDLPPIAYSKHAVIRRKQVMDDLIATVRKNPGCNMMSLAAAFSYKSGLKRTTILEYLQTLLMAKAIRRSGGKLYA